MNLLILYLGINNSLNNLNNLNSILPPINNIYKSTVNIPFIGEQNIEYERTKNLVSEIRLKGNINCVGNLYLNKNNIYDYTFDDNILDIIKKYKCKLDNPIYNKEKDIISFKLKVKIINFGKTITLKNIDNFCNY